jgi:phage shock protein A
MSDPIADRLIDLAMPEPPGVRLARHALERAQSELHALLRRRAPADVVEATRERVRRCHDLLEQRWHDAATSVASR